VYGGKTSDESLVLLAMTQPLHSFLNGRYPTLRRLTCMMLSHHQYQKHPSLDFLEANLNLFTISF
jgi:hypothetical protein